MIKFDINTLQIKHVYIKTITQALGGSVTIADPVTEETTRIPIPYAVARRFIKEHKVSHYIVPVLSALMYYDDTIVAVERHHLGNLGVEEEDGLFGKKVWASGMENYLDTMRDDFSTDNWYVDGTCIYQLVNGEQDTFLSSDQTFRTVPAQTYAFADFQLVQSVRTNDAKMKLKQCLKFVVDGIAVISPPVWSSVDAVGKTKLVKQEAKNEDGLIMNGEMPYDNINDLLLVNVNFALTAAKDISEQFGYESIEPLCLDDLMVKMRTVNLPSLESHVKKTCEIGMSYTHTMAWLMGYVYRSETLAQIMNIRALFKYVASTGCYQKRKLTRDAVFIEGKGLEDVMAISVDCNIA